MSVVKQVCFSKSGLTLVEGTRTQNKAIGLRQFVVTLHATPYYLQYSHIKLSLCYFNERSLYSPVATTKQPCNQGEGQRDGERRGGDRVSQPLCTLILDLETG